MSERFPHRDDIDGLRALAVIPVCLFHAGVPGFGGGFVGVDVFFVISGFLMFRLISDGLDDGTFTFRGFYERRARRILPALAVVMALTLAAAWVVAPPKLFVDTGLAAWGASLFAANVVFWRGAAHYFDAPAEWNPLLHTWSLAVEEQFYLFFPVVLWLVHRWAPRARGLALAALGVVSFTLCVAATSRAPSAAFYLLPMRAWELVLGAIVAGRNRDTRPGAGGVAGLTGLALIAVALVWFDRAMAFPGWAATVPAAGTALILARPGPAARWLAARPLVAIGQMSYSLYLWHWPVLVFGWKYGVAGAHTALGALGLSALTVLLTWASWRWVEQPVRQRTRWPTRAAFTAVAVAATVVLAAAGVAIAASDGWPSRLPGFAAMAIDRELTADAADPAWQAHARRHCFVEDAGEWDGRDCRLGGQGPVAMLWGDSFANKMGRGLLDDAALPVTLLEYTSPQCAPVVGHAPPSRPSCHAFTGAVPGLIRQYGIATVILGANWSAHVGRRGLTVDAIARSIAALHEAGARVVLIGQGPIFPFAYADEYRYRRARSSADDATLSAPAWTYPELNAALATAGADAFIDPSRLFCDGGECRYRADGHYLFMDYGHVTAAGARRLVPAITAAVEPRSRR